MRLSRPLALVAVASLLAIPARAQSPELTGLARAAGDKHALSCVRVALIDSSGVEAAFVRTDWRGLFAVAAPAAGVYRLRFTSPMADPVLGPVDTLTDSSYVERVYELPFTLGDSLLRAATFAGDPDLHPILAPAPHYPDMLHDAGVAGEVLAEFVVDSAGAVDSSSIRIVRATHPAFGEAVSEALRKTIYRPQYEHGVAVCRRIIQPFAFSVQR